MALVVRCKTCRGDYVALLYGREEDDPTAYQPRCTCGPWTEAKLHGHGVMVEAHNRGAFILRGDGNSHPGERLDPPPALLPRETSAWSPLFDALETMALSWSHLEGDTDGLILSAERVVEAWERYREERFGPRPIGAEVTK